jgi:polyisoprenoid-binding protein YceI
MTRLMKNNAIGVFAIALMTAGAPAGAADDAYKISGGEVTVMCPLTVGGSFEAKTKNLTGDVTPAADEQGAVRGALRVELQTLETGIGIRDRHMKNNYLEVEKGPEFATAIIEDIRVEKLEGKTVFSGMLTLHGQKRKVTGAAELQQKDGRIRVQAQFPLKVSDFDIPAPTYLGVGVRDEIQIKVSLMATSSSAAAAVGTSGQKR